MKKHGEPRTLADLQSHSGLIGTKDSWNFQVDGTSTQVKVKGRWQSNSGVALLDAVEKGLGIAQLPDHYVLDKIQRGELVSVLDDFRCSDPAVWAVYPYNRNLSAKVRLFVDFLSERFEKQLPWIPNGYKKAG